MKALIYPVFIPFMGCSYRCVYCNQHLATSVRFSHEEVVSFVHNAIMQHVGVIKNNGRRGEVAFFGGTFTNLPFDVMKWCLEEAARWVEQGLFTGIRFSTRPDCFNDRIFHILSCYPVSTVELGVQSLNDSVLKLSGRRYSRDTVVDVSKEIKNLGWKLGIQLMPGLPSDSKKSFMDTVEGVRCIKPDFVRLYPTIVFKNTVLESWYRKGQYVPLSLKDAIKWCVDAVNILEGDGIAIIRIGLQANEELNSGAVVAGPYHPSLGYLVRVHWWRQKFDEYMTLENVSFGKTNRATVFMAKRYVSEFIGPSRINLLYWKKKWGIESIEIETKDSYRDRYFEVHLLRF